MDGAVIEPVIVNAALFHRAEDPLLFDAHAGKKNTKFESSLHKILRRGGVTPPLLPPIFLFHGRELHGGWVK